MEANENLPPPDPFPASAAVESAIRGPPDQERADVPKILETYDVQLLIPSQDGTSGEEEYTVRVFPPIEDVSDYMKDVQEFLDVYELPVFSSGEEATSLRAELQQTLLQVFTKENVTDGGEDVPQSIDLDDLQLLIPSQDWTSGEEDVQEFLDVYELPVFSSGEDATSLRDGDQVEETLEDEYGRNQPSTSGRRGQAPAQGGAQPPCPFEVPPWQQPAGTPELTLPPQPRRCSDIAAMVHNIPRPTIPLILPRPSPAPGGTAQPSGHGISRPRAQEDLITPTLVFVGPEALEPPSDEDYALSEEELFDPALPRSPTPPESPAMDCPVEEPPVRGRCPTTPPPAMPAQGSCGNRGVGGRSLEATVHHQMDSMYQIHAANQERMTILRVIQDSKEQGSSDQELKNAVAGVQQEVAGVQQEVEGVQQAVVSLQGAITGAGNSMRQVIEKGFQDIVAALQHRQAEPLPSIPMAAPSAPFPPMPENNTATEAHAAPIASRRGRGRGASQAPDGDQKAPQPKRRK